MDEFRTWVAQLKAESVTQREIASWLNWSDGHLSNVLNGKAPMTPDAARRIEELSQGRVTRLMLLPEIFGPIGQPAE